MPAVCCTSPRALQPGLRSPWAPPACGVVCLTLALVHDDGYISLPVPHAPFNPLAAVPATEMFACVFVLPSTWLQCRLQRAFSDPDPGPSPTTQFDVGPRFERHASALPS